MIDAVLPLFCSIFSQIYCLQCFILLSIYPARELPIPGVNTEVLANKISSNVKVSVIEKHELLPKIEGISARVKVLLGAGDIGLEVEKIKQKLI